LDVDVLVLVVDDEPDVEALFRQQFRRDLRSQRFMMDFANSASDALRRVASTIEQSLILILSDINMPGMTGLEMLPKVKEIRPEVPVIMITAYGDPDTRRKALENGASGLLTKPIDFTLLREEIVSERQIQSSGRINILLVVLDSNIRKGLTAKECECWNRTTSRR
jgi:CheY-like chemotaxis protein